MWHKAFHSHANHSFWTICRHLRRYCWCKCVFAQIRYFRTKTLLIFFFCEIQPVNVVRFELEVWGSYVNLFLTIKAHNWQNVASHFAEFIEFSTMQIGLRNCLRTSTRFAQISWTEHTNAFFLQNAIRADRIPQSESVATNVRVCVNVSRVATFSGKPGSPTRYTSFLTEGRMNMTKSGLARVYSL